MQAIKKYFSLLLIVLVCIPIADKAWDNYSHLREQHCDDVSTHYCATEHHCTVCDYVFSSSSDLPPIAILKPLEIIQEISNPKVTCSKYRSVQSTTVFLRGPPLV